MPQKETASSTLKAPSGLRPHVETILQRIPGGTRIGTRTIVGILGVGSHGVVFHARDQQDRDFAIKFLNLQHVDDWKTRLEALDGILYRLSLIDHPSLIRVLEGGNYADLPFMVMDLHVGPLREPLNLLEYSRFFGSRLEPAILRKIFLHLLHGISCAHRGGVLHGNLKPSNILFQRPDDDKRAPEGLWRVILKVADFGLADLYASASWYQELQNARKHPAGPEDPADTRALSETAEFFCPVRLQNATPASISGDIYALGRILVMLLTGMRHPLQPPSRIVEGLDPAWDQVVVQATSSDPSTRFSSVAAMAKAMEALPG